MKNKFCLPVILTLFITLVHSCKKEGPPGPAGKDGNANVKTTTITFSSWTWDGNAGYSFADFTWGAITSDIVNTGGVFIYVSNGSGGWLPLPRTIFPTSSYTQSQRYIYSTGFFRVIVQDSDLLPPVSLGTWTIKILAVAGSLREANPNLDWSNYEAVRARLRLRD